MPSVDAVHRAPDRLAPGVIWLSATVHVSAIRRGSIKAPTPDPTVEQNTRRADTSTACTLDRTELTTAASSAGPFHRSLNGPALSDPTAVQSARARLHDDGAPSQHAMPRGSGSRSTTNDLRSTDSISVLKLHGRPVSPAACRSTVVDTGHPVQCWRSSRSDPRQSSTTRRARRRRDADGPSPEEHGGSDNEHHIRPRRLAAHSRLTTLTAQDKAYHSAWSVTSTVGDARFTTLRTTANRFAPATRRNPERCDGLATRGALSPEARSGRSEFRTADPDVRAVSSSG